jgi:hypothetical protein
MTLFTIRRHFLVSGAVPGWRLRAAPKGLVRALFALRPTPLLVWQVRSVRPTGRGTQDDRKEVKALNSTGHKCPQSGIWSSACHHRQIALSRGDTFPPCPTCHNGCNWRLIQPTQ